MQDRIDKNLVIENTMFDDSMEIYDVTKEPFKIYGLHDPKNSYLQEQDPRK